MSIFTEEFKKAISHLSSKEKDKLLLRLLKKDLNLAKRLFFELVDTKSVEEHRLEIENIIITQVAKMAESLYSIGYLNMEVRYLSGSINEHVSKTKDKYGNASLNLLLLNEVLRVNKNNILTAIPPAKFSNFSIAIIARVFKVLLLINKMDDDFLLDFNDNLIILGKLILENEIIMNTAIKNGLDVNWLINSDIPIDIVAIHKELKNNGYL